jgi:hypothetical protein
MKINAPFVAALAALALATSTSAQTYDATADFGIGSNPNGVWTYGVTTTVGGTLDLLSVPSSTSAFLFWNHPTLNDLNTPLIAKNISGGPIANIPNGFLTLHPGPTTQAVLRFTAPTTASYSLSTQFFSGDLGETTGFVLHNGTTLFSDTTTSDSPSFGATLTLQVGDTLDIVVDKGADDYLFDNTPVTLVLQNVSTAAPEPATVALFLPSGLVWLVRRRRG